MQGQESTTIYYTAIKLSAQPGLIKITLPANTLKPKQTYRWYLMVNCRASRNDEPDAVVDGWIQRKMLDTDVQANKQKVIFYTKNYIWYDAINHVAEQHFKYPDNPEIQAVWNNLLKALGKQWAKSSQDLCGQASRVLLDALRVHQ